MQSDIWSFGLTVWELAVGHFPLANPGEIPMIAVQRIVLDNFRIEQFIEDDSMTPTFLQLVKNW